MKRLLLGIVLAFVSMVAVAAEPIRANKSAGPGHYCPDGYRYSSGWCYPERQSRDHYESQAEHDARIRGNEAAIRKAQEELEAHRAKTAAQQKAH